LSPGRFTRLQRQPSIDRTSLPGGHTAPDHAGMPRGGSAELSIEPSDAGERSEARNRGSNKQLQSSQASIRIYAELK
jgi:hypothetical protein